MSGIDETRDDVDHERMHRASFTEAVQAAVATLRARGVRVTAERRAVIEALADTHEHLSADEVAHLLEASSPKVHRATAYRALDLLVELGIASRRHATNEATTYHLVTETSAEGAHLHAHCRLCGSVVGVPADALDAARRTIAAEAGFVIEPPQTTLVGLCARCAAAA
ncbi:MAG: Fur family transcriptional regulator [Microbacterium sp.]